MSTANFNLYNSCAVDLTVYIGNYKTYSDDISKNQFGALIPVGAYYTFEISYNSNSNETNYIEIVSYDGTNYNLYQLIPIQGKNYTQIVPGSTLQFNMIDTSTNLAIYDDTNQENIKYMNTDYGQTLSNLYIIYQNINKYIQESCAVSSGPIGTQLSTADNAVGYICILNDYLPNPNNVTITNKFQNSIILYVSELIMYNKQIGTIGNDYSFNIDSGSSVSISLTQGNPNSYLYLIYQDSSNSNYGVFQLVSLVGYNVYTTYSIALNSTISTTKKVTLDTNLSLSYISNNINSYISNTPCFGDRISFGASPYVICVDIKSMYSSITVNTNTNPPTSSNSTTNSDANYWIFLGIIALILFLIVIAVIIYLVISNRKNKTSEIHSESPKLENKTQMEKKDIVDHKIQKQ